MPLTYHGAVANDRLPELLASFDACVALSFQSEHGGTSGVSNALLEQMENSGLVSAMATNGNRDLIVPKRDE